MSEQQQQNCRRCDRPFTDMGTGARPRLFCSRSCKGVTKPCEHCGVTFRAPGNQVDKGGGKFCSKKCYTRAHQIERVCLNCGVSFTTKVAYAKAGWMKFCSAACYWKTGTQPEDRVCRQCGLSFSFLPRLSAVKCNRGRFCSQGCAHKSGLRKAKPRAAKAPAQRSAALSSRTVLYRLYDPRDGAAFERTRYIGKKAIRGRVGRSLSNRLSSHLRDAAQTLGHNHRLAWIRSLLKDGVKPVMEPLCIVATADAAWFEMSLIAGAKAAGCRLVNATAGGEGISGYRHTEASKRLMSINRPSTKGRALSVEHRRRITESMRRPETRAQMSASAKRWREERRCG